MSDNVKAALEALESTFRRVHHVATGQSNESYMSIPADPKRDADLQHMAALDLLSAHIDGEPARVAAAEARAREEQRETDAMRCDYVAELGEDGLAREVAENCADRVRCLPLDPTPCADEESTLRARVKELEERLHADNSLYTETLTLRDDVLRLSIALAARDAEVEGLDRWPVLRPFIAAMVRKLDKNKPKKGGREGWIDNDPRDLLKRVLEETGELARELNKVVALGDTVSETAILRFREAVLNEAADVANMVMMVADASGALDAVLAKHPPQDKPREPVAP